MLLYTEFYNTSSINQGMTASVMCTERLEYLKIHMLLIIQLFLRKCNLADTSVLYGH